MDEPEVLIAYVCSTPGCENEGIAIAVPDNGFPTFCGPCGADITASRRDYDQQ